MLNFLLLDKFSLIFRINLLNKKKKYYTARQATKKSESVTIQF